jgi:uncharacterized SAM-binding protein YcdF (DUF218 family)
MSHALEILFRPTLILNVILAVTLVVLWRKWRDDRRRLLWAIVPFVLLTIISIPAVAYLLMGTLEWSFPPSSEMPDSAQALVVLSGYMYAPDDGSRAQAELSWDTYYRCRHALRMYQRTKGCPILVSGGLSEGAPHGPPLADAMRDFFIEHGVKAGDLIVENQSLNTHENAVFSSRLLRERGIQRIVLITEAKHIWRATKCFQNEGMEVSPSACNHFTTRFRHRVEDYLPSPYGAAAFLAGLHEWVGVAYYKLRGWI